MWRFALSFQAIRVMINFRFYHLEKGMLATKTRGHKKNMFQGADRLVRPGNASDCFMPW
jgi:hypothetical protein